MNFRIVKSGILALAGLAAVISGAVSRSQPASEAPAQQAGGPPAQLIPYPATPDYMPAEAKALLHQLAAQTIDEGASQQTKQILNSLRALQKRYTTSGKLDDAVAVRDGIREFKQRMAGILPDPGNLVSFRNNVGRSYLFAVVGSTAGSSRSDTIDLLSESAISNYNLGADSTIRGAAAPVDSNITRFAQRGVPQNNSGRLPRGSLRSIDEQSLENGRQNVAVNIWGTDFYTDDSPLAAVAVHAGILREGQKGVVRVTIFAGREQYEGSTHNGVVSSSYGAWDGSYMVEKAPPVEPEVPAKLSDEARTLIAELGRPALADGQLFDETIGRLRLLKSGAEKAAKLDDALMLREAITHAIAARFEALPDPGTLMAYRGQQGRVLTFQITGRTTGNIWGSEIYTDDSDLGTVAVHAGLLKPGQSGIVKVSIQPGLASYGGANRNGIASRPYGSWTGSYRIGLVSVY